MFFKRTAIEEVTAVLQDAGYWFRRRANGSLAVYYPDWSLFKPGSCLVTKGDFFVNISEDTILAGIKKVRCTFHTGEVAYLTVREISKLLYKTFDITSY